MPILSQLLPEHLPGSATVLIYAEDETEAEDEHRSGASDMNDERVGEVVDDALLKRGKAFFRLFFLATSTNETIALAAISN